MAEPFEAVNAEALVGQVLDGRYRVESVLGQGGMGMVFKGVQTSMQRPVALKTLHPQLAMAPAFFERFRREAEIASRLHHPNIITIFDFNRTADGLCYFVMEYLAGESLRQRVKRDGPMTLRQAAAVIEQATIGVQHAHHQNVVHRDLKPHNIMLAEIDGNEFVKVLDFGLVKALEQEEEEQLTSTGQVLGTPQYMPPEQAGGEVVDQRSDLYSLTGVFYYCLTGHSPFGANTVRKALQAALTQPLPPVATYRQGAPVPEAIDRFLVTGLQPEKDDRFQSAEDFLEALHAALAGAGDVVLDAVPRRTDEGAQEGAGSSSASRKGSQASRSGKIVTRSASAVGRQSARGQSSRVVVEEPPRSALPLIAGALALVVLGVGGAIAWKVGHPPEPPPEVTTPRAAVAPPEPTTTTPTPAHITLKTTPGGAEIAEDGVVLGTTPVTLDWAKDQRRTLTITLAGYKPLEKTLKPSADQEFEFALEASTPRPAVTHPVKPGPRKPDDGVSAFE